MLAKRIFIFFGEVGNVNVTMTWRCDGSAIAGGLRVCDASVGLVDLKDAKAVLCPRSDTNGSAAFAGGSDPKGRLCWVPLCVETLKEFTKK